MSVSFGSPRNGYSSRSSVLKPSDGEVFGDETKEFQMVPSHNNLIFNLNLCSNIVKNTHDLYLLYAFFGQSDANDVRGNKLQNPPLNSKPARQIPFGRAHSSQRPSIYRTSTCVSIESTKLFLFNSNKKNLFRYTRGRVSTVF